MLAEIGLIGLEHAQAPMMTVPFTMIMEEFNHLHPQEIYCNGSGIFYLTYLYAYKSDTALHCWVSQDPLTPAREMKRI